MKPLALPIVVLAGCRFTRDFLRRNPRGYSVQPARPGLTALLPRVRT
jgi:hypothetical protein